MSKYLWAILAMGVAGVAIYLVWEHYREKEEEPGKPEELEEEFPEVPEEPEVPAEPIAPVDDWATLAALEYADLHVCPICSMSFPSMSACAWHLKTDHAGDQFIPRYFPRYNKICVLLKVENTASEPLMGEKVKLYRDHLLIGEQLTDNYGCVDLIRLDEGEYLIVVEGSIAYGMKEYGVSAKLRYVDIKTHDLAGNESTITVINPYVVKMQLRPSVRFRCGMCGATFHTQTEYDSHMATDHVTGHMCPYCDKRFATASLLADHMRNVHPPTPEPPPTEFMCPICGAIRSTMEELERHIRIGHGY